MKLASNLGQLSNHSLHNPNLEQYRKKNPFQKEKVEKNTDQVQKPFDQELQSVAQEFESLFTHHMLKQMRSAVPKSDFLDGGNAENIFTDMLDQEIGKIASKRGIGIADMVYAQLRRS